MDKRIGIILAVVIGAVLVGMAATAWFALRTSDHILESFQRIDSGLDSVGSTMDDRSASSRAMLGSFMCAEMLTKADSVHQTYEALTERIDSFRSALGAFSPDEVNAAGSLFDENDRGTDLYKDLLAYYDLAERICQSDSLDLHIAQNADNVRDAMGLDDWREKYFRGMPALACRTILGKVRSEAVGAEALVMNDLLERCDPAKK